MKEHERPSKLSYTTNHMGTKSQFIVVNDRKPVWCSALMIALIYLVFGLSWIFFSDSILAAAVPDMELQHEIALWKGFAYVTVSALGIFLLIYAPLKRISDKEQVIRESRDELKALVYYDGLTALGNRRKFFDRLPQFLGVRSTPEEVIALLYINIDNSKLINDTLGHGFGDAFIKGVSSRIERSLTHGEEIYRSGGDEFVILARAPNERVIKDRSDALMKLFAEPLHVNEMDIHTSISVGVAIYPGHAKSPQELMKCADIALFQAKKAGKNRVCFFSISMMAPINERMRIGEKLHGALQRGEFEIHYQPQIRPESGTVASIEALLRWKNPVLGMVSPDTFIPVAEETLLIREIGSWVLRSACAFAKRLHDKGAAGLGVSVNISMVQILQEGFAGMVREAIASSGLDSSLLELEITESVLMESRSNVLAPLAELKAMGVGIALDDFGKGYSSLSYLQQLPITVLKIDKTFVDGISSKDPTASLAGNIVEIGKNLGLVVIAEGVETDDQLSFLRDRKCDKIQGWVYSKALPEAEAERFIRQNRGL